MGGGYEKDSGSLLQCERVARVSAVAHGLDDRIRVASAARWLGGAKLHITMSDTPLLACILPKPCHEPGDSVAEIGLRAVSREALEQISIGPCCRNIAHLHGHVVADSLFPQAFFDGIDEIQQADLV
jgi:hypothetical protein